MGLMEEAHQLFRAGWVEQALERYQAALAAAKRTGDRPGEGAALSGISVVHHSLGRLQEALVNEQASLAISKQLQDRSGEGSSLSNIAGLYHDLGQRRKALRYHEEALSVRRDAGDRRGEGVTLNNMGATYDALGEPDKAMRCFQEALVIRQEVGDRPGEAATLANLGKLYNSMGQRQLALSRYEEALTIAREGGDRHAEGLILNNIGTVYQGTSHYEKAVEFYGAALSIFRQTGLRMAETGTLTSLGAAHENLGRPEEAIEYHQQALTVARELGDRPGEGAALNNLANAYRGLGQNQIALEHWEGALALSREVDNLAGEAHILASMGELYRGLGRPAEALRHLEDALRLCRRVGDRSAEGTILNNVAAALDDLGDREESLRVLQLALALSREVGDRRSEGATLGNLGALYRGLGRAQEALDHYRQAVQVFEGVRGKIVTEELRTSYFGTGAYLYRAYVSLLVEQGQADQALHAAEQGKARSFLDLLAEAQAEVRQGVDPGLREEEQRLLGEMRGLRERLIGLRSRPEEQRDIELISELEHQEQELERAYQVNQGEIRRRNPRYAALTQPEAWEVGRIQQELLDENMAMLEYVLGEQGSFLFVVLKDDFEVFFLPPREEIETKVRELRAAVVYGMHRYPHGHKLYEALVKPAERLIEGKEELLIVADGALHYLPFALLLTEPPEEGEGEAEAPPGPTRAPERGGAMDEDERKLLEAALAPLPPFDWARLSYLVRRHAISYAPSATVAGMLHREVGERQQQVRRYHGQLAAFADPLTEGLEAAGEGGMAEGEAPVTLQVALTHTRGSLDRIPRTADEVWALAGLLSERAPVEERREVFEDTQVHIRTGSAATKEAVATLTSGDKAYRFFHIASHGLVDTEKPQFSGLVFTPGERRDPFWQTFEIFNARIPSELVVLSACETGLGRLVSGEGIVGLTRAFMYAGTPSVCVSLWKVADVSSPELMRAFYQALLAGESKALALRAAQLRLLEEGTFVHPFYWAPFVLVGQSK